MNTLLYPRNVSKRRHSRASFIRIFSRMVVLCIGIPICICIFSSCDLFNLSVPDYINKYANSAAGGDYKFISNTNGTAPNNKDLHIIKPGEPTALDIILRNPRPYKLLPAMEYWNDGEEKWKNINDDDPWGFPVDAAYNHKEPDRIRVTIGTDTSYPVIYPTIYKMRVTLTDSDTELPYAPYELPLMKCSQNPPEPRIIDVLPAAGGGLILQWTLAYSDPAVASDVSDAVKMTISCSLGSETHTKNYDDPPPFWNNTSGNGTLDDPYISTIFPGESVPAGPLNLNVFNEDDMISRAPSFYYTDSAVVYVSNNGTGSGMAGEYPTTLSAIFNDSNEFIIRYSNIRIIFIEDITSSSNYTVPQGKTISMEPTNAKDIIVTQNASGSFIDAGSGESLIFRGSVTGNRTLTFMGRNGNEAALVAVNGGTFTMQNGASIAGNTNTSPGNGGGVYVSGGTFEMNGGDITGNTALNGGAVYVGGGTFRMNAGTIGGDESAISGLGNTADSGGGVYVSGSGIFEMNGGDITGNKANGTGGSNGGGAVYVTGGTFRMNAGTIGGDESGITGIGNTADSGGGVYVAASGTFEMNGGIIEGNKAGETDVSNGGGVYVSGAIFRMNGGSIGKNCPNEAVNGGGVYLNNGTMTMGKDAKVTGNTVEKYGGGIFLEDSKLTMGENAEISDNSTTSSSGGGGGIYLRGGEFEMIGGIIGGRGKGNTSFVSGGAVFIESGTFTMSRTAVISGNSTMGTTMGGAVYVGTSPDALFNMLGGIIGGDSSDDANTTGGHGGAVAVDVIGSFTMTGGTIKGNKAGTDRSGGGVYVRGTFTMGGTAKIIDNSAGYGGGAAIERDNHPGGIFTMTGGTIEDNTATNGGGGVYVKNISDDDTARFTMIDGTIKNNQVTAGSGGGVYVINTMSGGDAVFTMQGGIIGGDSSDDANKAQNGGGVYINSGKVTMSGTAKVKYNSAGSNGGGIYVDDDGNFTMANTGTPEISHNNTSYAGGGVHVNSGGSFTMDGGNINENEAREDGGGGGVSVEAGNFILNSGYITRNTGPKGGGVGVYSGTPGAFTMHGGYITGNTADDGGGVYAASLQFFSRPGNNGFISGNTPNDINEP